MKTRSLSLLLTVLVMAGCGGGGSTGGGASTSTGAGSTVTGVASKGPVRNGHYSAYQIYSSNNPTKSHVSDTAFFSGTTGADGSYSFQLPAGMTRDGVMVKVTDGAYHDEATGVDRHVETEYPGGMRAAYGNISGAVKRGGSIKMCVSPYTEMAVKAAGATLDDNSVKSGRTKVEHAFGLDTKGVDVIETQPLDPNGTLPSGSSAEKSYALALKTISQYEKDNGGTSGKLSSLSDDLLSHMDASGELDSVTKGKFGASGVSTGLMTQPTQAILKLSTTGVAAGTLIGGMNITLTLPAGVTVKANPDKSSAAGVVLASGAAASSNAQAIGNAGTAGSLGLGIITTSGFAGGECMTVTADIAPGTFPSSADFSATVVGNVVNTTAVVIPNVGVSLALTTR